jgi:hypothetical protein
MSRQDRQKALRTRPNIMDEPKPTHFMSPSSDDPITSMTQTCRESRFVAMEEYFLLFPDSPLWFSSADFLHIDFGGPLHALPYTHRHFIPKMPINQPSRLLCLIRYAQARFDEKLLAKVKNLAVNDPNVKPGDPEFNWPTLVACLKYGFPGAELIVVADQLFNTCHEEGEELVWTRGQIGDEMSSPSLPERAMHGESWRESDIEREHRHLITSLLLWTRPSYNYKVLKDRNMREGQIEEIQAAPWSKIHNRATQPTIIRKSITTARTKKELLRICGSEDNFHALVDLDWQFVTGDQEYKGPLSLSSQLIYLQLLLARTTADIKDKRRPWNRDNPEYGEPEKDVPFLRHTIDTLVREITRLQLEENALKKNAITLSSLDAAKT